MTEITRQTSAGIREPLRGMSDPGGQTGATAQPPLGETLRTLLGQRTLPESRGGDFRKWFRGRKKG